MAELQEQIARIIKDIKGSLSCPVCFGTLINPLTIKNCGHALCSLCVKGIIGANKDGRCPVCSKGSFSRRKGTLADTRLSELIECIDGIQANKPAVKDLAAKTDGFLLKGPTLGRKKKVVGRKRKGRPVFSLESNPEVLEADNPEIPQLIEFPSTTSSPQILSVSLLQEENNQVEDPRPHLNDDISNETTVHFVEDIKSGLKETLSSVTLYPPPRASSYKRSKTETHVQFFFDTQKLAKDVSSRREGKVCPFYQLSSTVPRDPPSSKPKYPSIIDILRKNKRPSFKAPQSPHNQETPHRSSSCKKSGGETSTFRQVHHRRLINDSTPSRNLSAMHEFGSARRLSKEKILAAEPMTTKPHAPPKTVDQSSPPVKLIPRDGSDDEDFPEGPMSLKKVDLRKEEGLSEAAGDATQEVIKRMNQLKAIAAELNRQEENVRVPPSDEDDEMFPSTPELLPKKRKRPSSSLSSARKMLKKTIQDEEVGYVFPPRTKIMSSALYSESDNSIYGQFREAYQSKATFMSGGFDTSVDILVVGTLSENDVRCNRTVKYLYAIACGKLIVSLGWIRDCMQRGVLLDPTGYIVKDYSGLEGPRTSYNRTENTPPFFGDFEFGLVGEFESDFGVEEVGRLIRYGGGRLVRNVHLMVPSENGIHLLIADKDGGQGGEAGRDVANKILKDVGVVTVDKDWVVESVGKYALEMIDSYLINDTELLYTEKVAHNYRRLMEEDLEDD